jgi:type II secretory pathway pseudopilin PulG
MRGQHDRWWWTSAGASLLEILFALSVSATASAIAIPVVDSAIDEMRTAMAARYLEGRIHGARMDAVRRSRAVGLRFQTDPDTDYAFAAFGDGNGNGVRTSEIGDGIDVSLGPVERLGDRFPGVSFGLDGTVPDADGRIGTGEDGLRIGTARIVTMSSDGTATSGTLYIRGRRAQYAVRVLGATGRTRMLQYDQGSRTWIDR